VIKAQLHDISQLDASGGTDLGKKLRFFLSVSLMKSSISCITVAVTVTIPQPTRNISEQTK
jgi:hypothetical protein